MRTSLFSNGAESLGMFYLVMVTTIVVLLIWSYFLATFTSPGYPSEVWYLSGQLALVPALTSKSIIG